MHLVGCPRCKLDSALRSARRRGFIERFLLKSLGFFPYRCEECTLRFFRHGRGRSSQTTEAPMTLPADARERSLVGQDNRKEQNVVEEAER
jgi:hypothetical protein